MPPAQGLRVVFAGLVRCFDASEAIVMYKSMHTFTVPEGAVGHEYWYKGTYYWGYNQIFLIKSHMESAENAEENKKNAQVSM